MPQGGQSTLAAVMERSGMMAGTFDESFDILDKRARPFHSDADASGTGMGDQEVRRCSDKCTNSAFHIALRHPICPGWIARYPSSIEWNAVIGCRLPLPRPLLATICMQGTAQESNLQTTDLGDGSASMEKEVRCLPCGERAVSAACRQPAVVFMVTIDHVQRHREATQSFMQEFVQGLWEEAEVTNLDRGFNAVLCLRFEASLVHEIQPAMAITENEDQHQITRLTVIFNTMPPRLLAQRI